MAASVDVGALRKCFQSRVPIAIGLACQYVLLPLIALTVVVAFQLDPVYGVILLSVCASPGGAYSNWWCSIFNADLALSVAMTTCSTLVALAMTPLNTFLLAYLAYGRLPTLNVPMFIMSCGVAGAAILSGIACSYWRPQWRSIANLIGNLAGITLIAFGAIVSSRRDPIWNREPVFYIAVALPCVLGMCLSFVLTLPAKRVTWPEAVSITVEVCYQNTGLALSIALATFRGADVGRAAGVPIYYGVCQIVCLPVFLVIAWKAGLTYAPRSTNVLKVVLGNFQPRCIVNVMPNAEAEAEDGISGQISPTPMGACEDLDLSDLK
eukprot:TRINITY_DN1867_c0_g1_i1.p1 TRINITY_DN1867_c0_g1~~TRINITY_DN1867_c0_g1_i1.p1  ORF type:complete len:362 (-),score=15.03 TRINITY_DN1867_c0_g1_i1:226-1194(-)